MEETPSEYKAWKKKKREAWSKEIEEAEQVVEAIALQIHVDMMAAAAEKNHKRSKLIEKK